MRFARKLAWTVTPLVAVALSVAGIAVAENAWHTGVGNVQGASTMATLKPVTMTATLASPIWPGQPIMLVAHFNNPNPVPVTINSIEADHVTYVVGSQWSDALGHNTDPTTVVMGATGNDSFALQYPVAHMFDLSANFIAPVGRSDVNITGPTLSVAFGTTLAQGSAITFSYNVSETYSAASYSAAQ